MYTSISYIIEGYHMIRTQIYITEEEKKGIDSVTLTRRISQSEFIRQAIDELLTKTATVNKTATLDKIAGIWSGKEDTPHIRELRTGWRNRAMR